MSIRDIVKIISYSNEPFSGRIEAGELLGYHLKHLIDEHPVVVGIPRGGVIIAREIVHVIDGELDVVLCRKIGAPRNPELAIGAVSEEGKLFLDERVSGVMDEKTPYIIREKEKQMAEIERRKKMYREIKPKINLEGRTVIITDDGVATGSTMKAAAWSIQQENPEKIIIALPVAPSESLDKLSDVADEIICLRTPRFFEAISQFYSIFNQVDDSKVLEILKYEFAHSSGQ